MTMFSNVKGWNNGQLTERDFDTERSNALARDLANRQWRESLTVTDGAAVLYRCGCVAAVKQTDGDARQVLHRLPDDKRDGATVVPASAGFVGPLLTVWAPDGTELPYSRYRCMRDHWGYDG